MTSAYRALKAALRAFARMPILVLTTFVLISALGVFGRIFAAWIGAPFPPLLPQDGTAHHAFAQDPFILTHNVIMLLTNVIRAFFIAPLAVSVHRFVLTGDAKDKVALDLSVLDVRFGAWAATTGAVIEILADVPGMSNLHGATRAIWFVLADLAFILVLPRICLAFPLLATGVAAPLGKSWSLTKHHVARIASVTIVLVISTFLLIVVLYLPCRLALHFAAQAGWIHLETVTMPAVFVFVFAGSTLSVGALAAMASNFLLAYRKPEAE